MSKPESTIRIENEIENMVIATKEKWAWVGAGVGAWAVVFIGAENDGRMPPSNISYS
jgi:hypothetical protein